MKSITPPVAFPTLLQSFFCQRLIAERNASAQTVASYRDAFRLLIPFAAAKTKKEPSLLMLSDLDAPLILEFLDHIEKQRGNCIRTRNARLGAIRSFMRYASFRDPTCLATVQRVRAIPTKRCDKPLLDFLSREEMQAIIGAPDRSTWSGHRDHVMFTTFYNTGARVSEMIRLQVGEVLLNHRCFVEIHGKGRKERSVPLWKDTAARLREWLSRVEKAPEAPVFPNRTGKPLSRSGVEDRLALAVREAARNCPSLNRKNVSPHTIRHTTAMHLLQAGVDITVIALWLGHETLATTHIYVEADLAMKERALGKLQNPDTKPTRYKPSRGILAFLESL